MLNIIRTNPILSVLQVKIHPKMLGSRPPLNCQKCQWRFFTDQGLERHLLGAHGLVTSNMQDLVDNSDDGGRCTICGRAFANQLVAHMNQVSSDFLYFKAILVKILIIATTFANRLLLPSFRFTRLP